MHHAMTDRDGQASDLCAQELHDLAERRRHVARLRSRPGLVDEDVTLRALGDEVRLDADALDLAFQAALQPIAGAD